MPQSPAYARALRKRDELLEAYEALDAQLSSALQQLSWTLALRPPRSHERASNGGAINADSSPCISVPEPLPAPQRTDSMDTHQLNTLHIMVIVGASLNAPKARVVIRIDNFEICPFGWREDMVTTKPLNSSGMRDGDLDPEGDELSELAEQLADTSLASGTSYEDNEVDGSLDDEDIEKDETSDNSFDSAADSVVCTPAVPRKHDSHEDEDEGFEEYEVLSVPSSSTEASPFNTVSRAPNGSVTVHIAKGPSHAPSTVAENTTSKSAEIPGMQSPSSPNHPSPSSEAFIRRAERLVYRTLAAPPSTDGSCVVEDEEELPLSQTTVLIRAPRRFRHASFLPRQTYSKELDDALNQCLSQHSVGSSVSGKGTRGVRSRKVKTEGIQVSCKETTAVKETARHKGSMLAEEPAGATAPKESAPKDDCQVVDVEDEMIWWQWTGKLKGIGDELFGY